MTVDRRSFLATAAAGLGIVGIARTASASSAVATTSYDIPLTLSDGRVSMDVAVNGQGPFKVVLDTGGQMSLVDKQFADRLRLPTIGTRHNQRVGRNMKSRDVRRVDELIFAGQLRQTGAVFLETDDVRFRDGAVASLAAGFLTSYDSELDLARQRLRIFPSGGPDRSDWYASENAIVPAQLDGWSPHLEVDAKLGDVAFRPLIDTGAPRGILISPDLAAKIGRQSDKWSPAFKRGDKLFQAYRVNGALAVGPLVMANPVVIEDQLPVSVSKRAIVGLEILRRLNIATDVKRGRVFLKINANPAVTPRYNMSGLWIDRVGSTMVAGAVGRGSPAELAGIKVGDPLSGMDFQTLIAALNGIEGSSVPLVLGKGSTQRSINLELVDYL